MVIRRLWKYRTSFKLWPVAKISAILPNGNSLDYENRNFGIGGDLWVRHERNILFLNRVRLIFIIIIVLIKIGGSAMFSVWHIAWHVDKRMDIFVGLRFFQHYYFLLVFTFFVFSFDSARILNSIFFNFYFILTFFLAFFFLTIFSYFLSS